MTFTSSVFHLPNLTINHLYQSKYIDHSPLYSLSKKTLLSNIQLSKVILKQFSSPVFKYYSSSQNMQIFQSSFHHFILTSLYMDEETYNDQTFSSNICLSTSTIFKNCIFQIDLTDDYFIQLSGSQFEFDYCQFINSTIDKTSIINIEECQATFRHSIFSNIQGNGASKIIQTGRNFEDHIAIEFINFTLNSVEGELIKIWGSTLIFNNCILHSNNCLNLISLVYTAEVIEPNIINDVIMMQNQINSKTQASEILIQFESNNNPVILNRIIINDEIFKYSLDHYHIIIINTQEIPPIHINNCCFSNPREKWANINIIDDNNNTISDDCFDIHLKNVQYGIIGDEFVVLQIPRRLLKYFPDSAQE